MMNNRFSIGFICLLVFIFMPSSLFAAVPAPPAQAIAAVDFHNIALMDDGTLRTWGSNYFGQLGDGTNTDKNVPVQAGTDSDWAAVTAGDWHTMGVKTNGTLWAWGSNGSGQLGDGTLAMEFLTL